MRNFFLPQFRGDMNTKPLSTRSLSMLRRRHLLVLLACVIPSSAFAQKPPRYTYTKFDVLPNASLTQAFDINHAGTIVGLFKDAAGTHGSFQVGILHPG